MNRIQRNCLGFTISLLLCIPSFPVIVRGQAAASQRKVDKSTLLYLFQHQLFKSLQSKLEEYQSAYENEYLQEDNLFDAYDAFSRADTSFQPLFVSWTKEYPETSPPYIARAKFYCAQARQARGSKLIADKDQKEYKEMENEYYLALTDINEALKKNPRLDVCYAMVVEIGGAISNDQVKDKALATALKYHPYAYRVRLQYLQTLTPRKGGSYEMMQAFIDSCVRLAAFNPKLQDLRGAIPGDKASFFSFMGKYDEAVNMWTEALKYSENHAYYAERADAETHMQDYIHAGNDYDHALDLSPNDPEYLNRKASAVAMQQGSSVPRKTSQYGLRNDSQNENTDNRSLISDVTEVNDHMEKGQKFAVDEKYEEAIQEYNEAIRILPSEYMPYYNRGFCYSQLHNDDAALPDYLRVVELKPDYVKAYAWLTEIYANRGMYRRSTSMDK